MFPRVSGPNSPMLDSRSGPLRNGEDGAQPPHVHLLPDERAILNESCVPPGWWDSMLETARNFLFIVWSLYYDAGFWMLVAFLNGGFLQAFIPAESFKKWFRTPGLRNIVSAPLIGMLLPICSCGVVPLGLSLCWSGAPLPAVLAFMAAPHERQTIQIPRHRRQAPCGVCRYRRQGAQHRARGLPGHGLCSGKSFR